MPADVKEDTRTCIVLVNHEEQCSLWLDLPAVRGEDVDDEVLDGPQSLAWVQAQHKMWSAMAVMEWCGAGVEDAEISSPS